MKLFIDANVQDFLKSATVWLHEDATIHSFILSLATKYIESGKPMTLLARVVDGSGNLKIAGLQTEPNHALIVSNAKVEDSREFARLLGKQVHNLPGVNGPIPAVDSFATEWCAVKSCRSKMGLNLRMFELTSVQPPRPSPGFLRMAKPEDEKVIFQWLREFHHEAVPNDPVQSDEALYQDIRAATQKGQYFIWEDNGKCVCLAGSRRETATERWIAPVYSPPHLRRRGYATSLVAEVSQKIIESGKKGMLFTDLTNPTSNSIYQKVGYSPVADFKHFFFQARN